MSAESSTHNAVPLPIKLIAGICAVGMGMVAVATVLSSSSGFLLFLLSSIILNYGTVFFHQWLNQKISHRTNKREPEPDYLNRVLLNFQALSLISISKHHALGIAFASLALATLLAVAAYYLAAMFLPQVVILYSVAALLFFPIVFVVYRAFRRGIEDVWRSVHAYFTQEQHESFLAASSRNTPAWIWGKRIFIGIGSISCVAGGILAAALIHEGVVTTSRSIFGAMGGGLTVVSGPLAWMVFSLLFICMAGMMARSVLMFVNDKSLDEKVKLKHALFNKEAYLKDLAKDWNALNIVIKEKQLTAQRTKAAYLNGEGTHDDCNRAAHDLDVLYGQKDTLYHRYTLFCKPWFQPIFTSITILMTGFCLLGMLAHMARGSHAGIELMTHVTTVSEKLAMGIATALMWTGLVAETLFTATNVTDTMLEEGIGTQTADYDQRLTAQQTRKDAISRFAYPSSRIQHGIFDGALVANGASGHATKTGYGFVDRVAEPASFASAVRSAYERDPDSFLVTWDYKKADALLLGEEENPFDSNQGQPPKNTHAS